MIGFLVDVVGFLGLSALVGLSLMVWMWLD
jgi:hypothetical protein